ncbi:MAG: hypothetical protein WCA08_12980, partial [Desulfoferrobacter sp.]
MDFVPENLQYGIGDVMLRVYLCCHFLKVLVIPLIPLIQYAVSSASKSLKGPSDKHSVISLSLSCAPRERQWLQGLSHY